MGTKQSEIKEPLITQLSRKYYDYATNEQNLKHYRATKDYDTSVGTYPYRSK